MRGSTELCMDLILNPDKVKEAENKLLGPDWCKAYDRIWDVISAKMDGMAYWHLTWAPGRTFHLQNDFSYMISNEMFREFFLDNLVRQIEHIDYSMYHLDGVPALRHLDSLLEIDKLDAIQFIPGAGSKGYITTSMCLESSRPASPLSSSEESPRWSNSWLSCPTTADVQCVCWSQEQGEEVLKQAAR